DHMQPAARNPYYRGTSSSGELTRAGRVRLGVDDLGGRRVRTLGGGCLPAGEHRAIWAGRDDGGRPLSSGLYLVQLDGGDFVETRRVALVK
nr:hypothetical protein [bacterium]